MLLSGIIIFKPIVKTKILYFNDYFLGERIFSYRTVWIQDQTALSVQPDLDLHSSRRIHDLKQG